MFLKRQKIHVFILYKLHRMPIVYIFTIFQIESLEEYSTEKERRSQ